MCESINEQPPTKKCARNPPRGAPRELRGSPVSEKQPFGHKIHIIGDRKLKLSMQVVEGLLNSMSERFYTLGSLGPPGAHPMGTKTTPTL